MHSHQKNRLLLVACLLTIMGCDSNRHEPELSVEELVATLEKVSLDTEAQVQNVVANAASSPRAIMFVHVDWAPMEPSADCLSNSRSTINEFTLRDQ
jgi:hypothetical protein